MPIDGIDHKVVSRQVDEPLPQGPALRHHELNLPPVLDLRGKVDEPHDEEDERTKDYLEDEGPAGGRAGAREGGRERGIQLVDRKSLTGLGRGREGRR